MRDATSVSAREVVTHFVRREVTAMAYYEPLVHDATDVEGVHQLRVSARRLRSELGAMRGVLPRQPWGAVRGDLQWMGVALGRLRDLDVLGELFDEHVRTGTALADAVTAAIDRRRATRRREVRTVLASSRYARLIARLARLGKNPPMGGAGRARASELFLPSLWQATNTYVAAVGDPLDHRSDRSLHRVRIASKKCRYNFEVATLYVGPPARAVAHSLEAVQDVLGQVQDRSVAVAFLDTLALGEGIDLDVRRALRAEIRELRSQWVAHYLDARLAITQLFDQH